MKKIFFTVFMLLFLSACGGGGGGGSNNNNSGGGGGGGGAPSIVSGTAATGVALVGVVNVYGINGGSVLDVTIDASGNYSADVTGLTAPYFLVAVPANSSLASQYSWASGPGTANITSLTTLVIFYANGEQDLALLVGTWPSDSTNVTASLPDAQAMVNANFVDIFSALDPTLDIDFMTYDFFSAVFIIGDIFDQILDLLSIDVTGGVASITVPGSTFTFNPDIGFSGIDIGGTGSGGVSMGLGSLTITGADTPVIGTSFAPTFFGASTVQTSTSVSWGGISGAGGMGISTVGNELVVLTYSFVAVTSGSIIGTYSYSISCWPVANTGCNNITVNVAGKSLALNNVSLPQFQSALSTNLSTGPITVDGTLTWE